MDLKEICCDDGRWMELAQDRVQWRALVSAALNFLVLPVEWSQDVSIDVATGCELDGQGSIPGRGEIFLFLTAFRLWGPLSLLSNEYRGPFPWV
jgi:hypothetical protein